MKSMLVLYSIFILSSASAGELYRYIDNSGRVQYSDKPHPEAERLKLGSDPAPNESLPYETQKAIRFFPVTLYVFEKCGTACDEAHQLLKNRGIPFTQRNLVTKEDEEEFRKISGSNQVPAMTIGKTWVKGFLAEQWHMVLDFAGYPKSAPYRAKPATP